jgi:hypothetical protein
LVAELLLVFLMRGFRSQFVWSLLAGGLSSSLAHPAFATQGHKVHKAATAQVAPPLAVVPQPLVPLTLEQMPATPPQVSYDHGELTIVARNSVMGDILRAVRDQTNATLDVPANANERVVGQIGPGPPREVLAQLLNGSRFNYVILGSATDANQVARVILTLKPAVSQDNAAQTPANAAPPSQQPEPGFAFSQQPANDDDDDNSETPADQAPTQAPVRTPEQLLQELQRQQQLQQQQPPPEKPGTPTPPQK